MAVSFTSRLDRMKGAAMWNGCTKIYEATTPSYELDYESFLDLLLAVTFTIASIRSSITTSAFREYKSRFSNIPTMATLLISSITFTRTRKSSDNDIFFFL